MKQLTALYNTVRFNGISRSGDGFAARSTVYLNLIWLATYGNLAINTFFVLLLQPSFNLTWIIGTALIHAGFLIIYYLVRNGGFSVARPWFILHTYAMIAFYDHLFGEAAYCQVFYFAFLPTAFNVYSWRADKRNIFLYAAIIPVVITITELYSRSLFPLTAWSLALQEPTRWFNIFSGFLLCVIYAGFIIFNTSRNQTKLITQSAALQTTLNNTIGALWSIDRDYNVIAVNKAFSQFAEKELRMKNLQPGYNMRSFTQDEFYPFEIRNIYDRVLAGESLFEEVIFRNEVYELRGEPILDEFEDIAGATFTSRIITHIKKAQQRLINARQDAEKASMARTLFLSNMSHELRTPLNGIIGLTNIMLSQKLPEEQKKNFEMMSNISEHMMLLINNILDFTKMEAGKVVLEKNLFHLPVFIHHLHLIFEAAAMRKEIAFQLKVTGNQDIYLLGDVTRLNQVMINLLSNAVKFTDKGTVTLVVDINKKNDDECLLEIAVEDTGIGIQPENLLKIFESFTQADANTTRQYGGTGLGLTIADGILKLMKSGLHVESVPGRGSVFSFSIALPLTQAPSPAAKAKSIDEMEKFGNVQVLLAEDNVTNQMVVRQMLKKWGIDTTIAVNGKEALTQAGHKEFQLILMDLDMPEMDGYECTAAIRVFDQQIPIIALTAASFENMRQSLMAKGFSDVVQKPFVPLELHEKIKSCLPV